MVHVDFKKVVWNRKTAFFALLVLVAYQLVTGVFFGFEFRDSGFYQTFYANLLDAPASVEYNFMYYLSGLVGGLFLKAFPGAGLVGVRLLGLVCNLLAIAVVGGLLRKRVGQTAFWWGMALVVFGYTMPMAFCYDLFTALLFVCAVCLLLKGLDCDSLLLMAAAAFVAAANAFVRVPNVLDFSIVVLIPLYLYYRDGRMCGAALRCGVFVGGYALGVACVLLLIWGLGHYHLFAANLRDLFSIAGETDGTATHTVGGLILAQLRAYALAGRFALEACVPLLLLSFAARVRWGGCAARSWSSWISGVLIALAYLGFALVFYREDPTTVLCAFCACGLLGGVFLQKDWRLKILSWAGLLMFMVLPLGSDYGMFNNGSIIYWIAAPVAVCFFMEHPALLERLGVSPPAFKRHLFALLALFLLVCCAKAVKGGVYSDQGFLSGRWYPIDNAQVRCVYTSEVKALAVAELTHDVASFLDEDACLLAFSGVPAVYYLLDVRPFVGCSWPEQLNTDLLRGKLRRYAGDPPAVLFHKFNSRSVCLDILTAGGEEQYAGYVEKKRIVLDFMRRHVYVKVWDGRFFTLWLPHEESGWGGGKAFAE